MNRTFPALILAGLLLNSCAARHAAALHDWKFWAGETVIAISLFEDGRSTCRNFRYGFVEGTGLAQGTHSCGVIAGKLTGAFAFDTGMNLLERHFGHEDPSPVIRNITPWVVPTIICAVHCTAAGHNYSLTPPEGKTNASINLVRGPIGPAVPVL